MDVSELRKRILRALDDARKEAGARRTSLDEAAHAYTTFLDTVAVPLFRQSVNVLRSERQSFTMHTPAGAVRLASDHSPDTYLEVALDTAGGRPQVMGRTSIARGRQGRLEERPIAAGKPIADITEADVSEFLVAEIPKLVVRT